MKFNFSNLRFWLLAMTLFGGAISLYPSISLAAFDFPSLRISLYHLAATLLILTSLPLVLRQGKNFLKNKLFTASIVLLSITLLHGFLFTESPIRTLIYSSGIIFLTLITIGGAVTYRSLTAKQKSSLVKVGLISGIIFGVAAIIQLFIASFNQTAFGTLCSGCHANVFGFVRINLLAAEPQFFASILLPAFFLALFNKNHRRLAAVSLFLTSLALALTFSRGAVAAIFAGYLAAFVYIFIKTRRIQIDKRLAVGMAGFLVGFGLLFATAVIRFPNTPHIAHNTAVSMIEQMTLGVIDIPQKSAHINHGPKENLPPMPTPESAQTTENKREFQPAGLVEASSNDRLSAAQLTIKAWTYSPSTILFGTGAGNLGRFIQDKLGVDVSSSHTVYIMYILVLGNLGLCGVILLIGLILLALVRAVSDSRPENSKFAVAVIIAIATHFWFFGSLINGVHCFAWIGLLLYNYPYNHAKEF